MFDPYVIATALLFIFLAVCAWFAVQHAEREAVRKTQTEFIQQGKELGRAEAVKQVQRDLKISKNAKAARPEQILPKTESFNTMMGMPVINFDSEEREIVQVDERYSAAPRPSIRNSVARKIEQRCKTMQKVRRRNKQRKSFKTS